mgnify:CR=1 FL=1
MIENPKADGRRQHPIDDANLVKGRRFTVAEIAAATGYAASHPKFTFARMSLAYSYIPRRMAILGRPCSVLIDCGEIVICDDAQAATYQSKRFRRGFRAAGRAHKHNLQVDQGRLSEEQRKTHERNLLVQGAVLTAAASAKRQLIPHATPRQKPALPAPEENRAADRMMETPQSGGG